MRKRGIIAVGILLALILNLSAISVTPYEYKPYLGQFTPIETQKNPIFTPNAGDFAVKPDFLRVLPTKTPEITPKPSKKPKIAQNRPQKPIPALKPIGRALWGHATWYCLSGVSPCMRVHPNGGYYAAAGPMLRRALGGGDHCKPGPGCWRNKVVTVVYKYTFNSKTTTRKVNVVLADWCYCPGNHTIDLYSDAMRVLEPRYRILGVIPVRIRW